MRAALFSLVVAAAACGGRAQDPSPPRPVLADEHPANAEHDPEALGHEPQVVALTPEVEIAPPYVCGNKVLGDQLSAGTEPLLGTVPCWRNEAMVTDAHRAEAERLRAEVAVHKEMAGSLVHAEELACEGLSADELGHTPFAHRDDVVSADELREDGELRGARIVFAQVGGLSANWMRQAVACHHARAAALGYNPRFMSYDPTVLQYASTMVNALDDGGLEIKVTSTDPEVAALIYARALALVPTRQARR